MILDFLDIFISQLMYQEQIKFSSITVSAQLCQNTPELFST